MPRTSRHPAYPPGGIEAALSWAWCVFLAVCYVVSHPVDTMRFLATCGEAEEFDEGARRDAEGVG